MTNKITGAAVLPAVPAALRRLRPATAEPAPGSDGFPEFHDLDAT
jgi:hypothetical protein